jgi:hypothetical protein
VTAGAIGAGALSVGHEVAVPLLIAAGGMVLGIGAGPWGGLTGDRSMQPH